MESEKIEWEKEISKVIMEKDGIAGKGEIISVLKERIRTDIQTLKNEVSAALVLNSNKTFRRQKVGRSFKYTLAIKQPAI